MRTMIRNDSRRGRMPSVRAARGVFAAVVAACVASAPARAQLNACRLEPGPVLRLTGAQGNSVFISPTATMVQRGRTLVAGHPVFPWPIADSSVQDSLFGVVADDSGRVTLIPAPHPGRRAIHPRLLPLAGGFETWFFELDSDIGYRTGNLQRGHLWTGRYREGRWESLRPVQRLTHVDVAQRHSSAIVSRGGTEMMSLSLDRTLDSTRIVGEPTSGVILVRRKQGAWSADTLTLSYETFYTQIAFDGRDEPLVAVVRPEVSPQGRPLRSEYFLGRWKGKHTTLQQISRAVRPAIDPTLHVIGNRIVAAWKESGTVQVRWLQDSLGSFVVTKETQLPTSAGFTVVQLDDTLAVLFTQDHASGALKPMLVTSERIAELPPLPTRDQAPQPFLWRVDPRTMLHVSGHLTPNKGESLADAFLTRLRVTCQP